AASYQTITVAYRTVDGTASAGAADFISTSGTLTFNPGETAKTVAVTIRGDTIYETDETFILELSSPTNASLGTASATGTTTYDGTERLLVNLSNPSNAGLETTSAEGIIGDDDFPTVSAASASVVEGNAGTTDLVFTLTLSNPSAFAVAVNYATADGSATAG